MRVLLTGAGGHVGRLLLPALKASGHEVTALVRRADRNLSMADRQVVETLSPATDFSGLLADIDAAIHLADGFNAYERLPVGAKRADAEVRLATTRALAEQAARNEQHFVYLSTIKTMCGAYATDILTERTQPRPQSLYGEMKLAAERDITAAVHRHGGSAVCLRFPIVFGTGRPDGNMEKLIAGADNPWPLPFKGLSARRSLISAASLIDATQRMLEQPIEGAQTFLLHDGAIGVEDLVRLFRQGLERPNRLFTLPRGMWWIAERSPVFGELVKRFTRSLELDDSLFRETFNWKPAVPLEMLLRKDASLYRQKNQLR